MKTETEKFCKRCDSWLPLSAFAGRSDTPDGKQYTCKPCVNEIRGARAAKRSGSRSSDGSVHRRGLNLRVNAADFDLFMRAGL